jgi:hypothetical protein
MAARHSTRLVAVKTRLPACYRGLSRAWEAAEGAGGRVHPRENTGPGAHVEHKRAGLRFFTGDGGLQLLRAEPEAALRVQCPPSAALPRVAQ